MADLASRAGLPVSVIAHVALIAWGVVSLPMPQPIDASSLEQIPVDFVEIDEVRQLTKGVQTAALVEELPAPAPKPRIEEPPPLPKPAPPPEPTPPPPQPQPEPPPVPPPPPELAPPPPTPSPEAQAPPPEVAPQPLQNVPMPRVRPNRTQQAQAEPKPKPDEKFDVDGLTAMLDRQAAEVAPEKPPTVGSPTAAASNVKMTANELDALRARLAECWSPPIGWVDPAEVRVVLLLSLNADGSVNGQPRVLEAPQGQFARQAPESALRAVRRCAPYNLPAEKYDAWREVKVTFDPQDMGRT